VIAPLEPDTLGVALTLGIATESEHGVDAGWDCCPSSRACYFSAATWARQIYD
jgi:hypothetical protein